MAAFHESRLRAFYSALKNNAASGGNVSFNTTSTISLLRKSENVKDTVLIVCNFTPVPRTGYRVGVPHGGYWRELLNSDAKEYGGSGMGNFGGVTAERMPVHGRPYALNLTLPPLAAVFFKKG